MIYIKDINSPYFREVVEITKVYEEDFFKGLKDVCNITLDDKNNIITVVGDTLLQYKLTDDAYLELYKEMVNYRKLLYYGE